jgi:hypothetical protein
MSRRDDLQALYDAVTAGAVIAWSLGGSPPRKALPMHWQDAMNAYLGSLDAAHALHKAVLPGWEWKRIVHPGPIASVGVWEPPRFAMGHTALENDANSARAWLLAILAALIAQEEAVDLETAWGRK